MVKDIEEWRKDIFFSGKIYVTKAEKAFYMFDYVLPIHFWCCVLASFSYIGTAPI